MTDQAKTSQRITFATSAMRSVAISWLHVRTHGPISAINARKPSKSDRQNYPLLAED